VIVEILYTRACPHHAPTVALVQRLARDLGFDAEIREVEVRGPEDAQRLRFLGSPSVRIDGCDIEPSRREHTSFSLSCRLYGRSGTPPIELITAALREVGT
jgi:hypothetical protein